MGELVASGDVLAGKYRVERILGRGGMGVVVAARHLVLERHVAIKLLAFGGGDREKAMDRFLREARAASALRSEHICKVFDFGSLENGTPFMVMEYLSGRDLAGVLSQRGPLPVPEAVRYALQACEALAEAHGSGIVHRDLKPANLFLTRANDGSRRVKVVDFGIAKLLPRREELAQTSTILGSPRYMSPEQLRARRELDGRSDIWSLGVTLYELLTGKCPFDGDNLVDLIAGIIGEAPRLPSRVAPGLPPALDVVLLRCLEKEPADRYQDIAAVARDLLPFAAQDAAPLVERVGRVLLSARRRQEGAVSARDAELAEVGFATTGEAGGGALDGEPVAAEAPALAASAAVLPDLTATLEQGEATLEQGEATLEQGGPARGGEVSRGALTETEPVAVPPAVKGAPAKVDLRFFEGIWKEWTHGTIYCARLHRGELRIIYRYGGDTSPHSTAEWHDARLIGNALFGRFQWVLKPQIKGYVYVRPESKDRLVGGWCYEHEMPSGGILELPQLRALAPLIWLREERSSTFPSWAERYFSHLEKMA